MKSFLRILIPMLLLILAVSVFAACSPNNGKIEDTTVAETTVLISTTAEETTDSETTAESETTTLPEETTIEETTAFNEGRVTYEIVKTPVFSSDEYPDADVGKFMLPTTKGVKTLFDQDFNTSDPNCGGKAISRSEGSTGVVSGKLCIPYNGSTGVGGMWTTWCPNVETNFTDYKQIQLSGSMEIVGGSGCTATGLIGCFVDNYTFSIADNYGDGIWLAFLKNPSAICVLGSDQAHWGWTTGGNVTVPVKENALEEQFSFDIVCTADKSTFVYINGELALSIKIADSRITVFDASEVEVYSEAYNMNSAKGSHFSIFGHGGGLMIDDMQVYGGEKTAVTEYNVEVTAKPCEGYSLGLDITDKTDLVGICYTMWFNAINGNGTEPITDVYNVSELLEQYKFTSRYGFGTKTEQHNALTRFHYWAEPAQGYYRSTDKQATRNNMNLLYAAGVDFIILDFTYATAPGYAPGTNTWKTYIDGPMNTLLDTIMEMRAEGLGTPYVVMWMNDRSLFNQIYTYYYGVEKWQDCFVYWNNKPFVMEWNNHGGETDTFTVRAMYGLQGSVSTGQWSYLEVSNKNTVSYDANGNPEHVCACVATQETYMSEKSAHGRNGGVFWNSQWKTAFEVHPKIVSVTWWNEWCAQLYDVGQNGSHYYVFTDNFNQEYSRDIEPMKGGHGDQYYRWLCEYVRSYKAHEDCPTLVEEGYESKAK